ncbi:hypothetical protein BS78_07G057100 [Paspalum vaginatum]|nr:hypothetical protein BS78_07G057100 [Paspalum vaginatum]
MARAAAPSHRPPSATAAAPSPPLAPHRRRAASLATATATAARSRSQSSSHRRRPAPPVVAPRGRLAPAPPPAARQQRAACSCSPTTHPGSFRCALHRGQGGASAAGAPVSSRLSAPRRASMANPLVRIAAVEGGDQVRRALAALVRPPPHRGRRAAAEASARPRPSRLSAMSSAAPTDRDETPPRRR